jgi:membrane fusion protein
MGLFRAETEQARATAWLGRIVLIRPLSFGLLTAAALAMTVALAGFFWFGEYTRKARVNGVLAPAQGLVKVLAQQSGIVEALHVREGQTVARGAPLAAIGDGRSSGARLDVGTAVATSLISRARSLAHEREFTLAALQTEQAAFRERRAGLARELERLDAEIATVSRRALLADESLGRARSLEATGFLSPAALDREKDAALDLDARIESARRTRLALAREFASVDFESETARSRAQAQLAAIDAQRAALDQERIEREVQYRASVVAPAAGTIAAVLVEQGQMVVPGMALLTIIPADATLEAQLFAPSRSIGFVRPGNEVLLRYVPYPHQKFGSQRATVVAISRNALSPGDLGFTPADGSREPVYRIKAALDSQSILAYGRPEPLQAGLQVEADILLDRRRLIEWIFEPLLSLAGRA